MILKIPSQEDTVLQNTHERYYTSEEEHFVFCNKYFIV